MDTRGGSSNKKTAKSTPDCGVWGDVDDWHRTLDLIARKWGPPSPSSSPHSASSFQSEREEGQEPPSPSTSRAGAALSTTPSPASSPSSSSSTPKPFDEGSAVSRAGESVATGKDNNGSSTQSMERRGGKREEGHRPAAAVAVAATPTTTNGPPSRAAVSRKQRYGGRTGASASLPRPSDVEALLRQATQGTQRASSWRQPRPSASLPVPLRRPPTTPENDDDDDGALPREEEDDEEARLTAVAHSAGLPPPHHEVDGTSPSGGLGRGAASEPCPNASPRGYSAPNDLRSAFVGVHHIGVPNNEGVVLPLHELQKRPVPPTLNKAALESYLSDDEFSSVLGMTRDQFYTLRAWKQTQVKKKAGLL